MDNVFISTGNLAGKGVYANREFKKGEVVISYNLQPIEKMDYDKLPESEKKFTHSFQGQIFLYSEPEKYVNHSKMPNTIQNHRLKADIALHDIKKGEMITCDDAKNAVE